MNLFYLNLCFALTVSIASGGLSFPSLALSFLAGYVLLWLLRPFTSRSVYFKTLPRVIFYVFYVLWELLISSIRVAIVILSPNPRITPGIVAVPLRLKSDEGIFVLANSITLTPGTLSLNVSDDKKTLYVHGMFIKDPEEFRNDIHSGFERRIAEFLK